MGPQGPLNTFNYLGGMFPHFVLSHIRIIEYVNRTVIETKSKINSYFFWRFRIRSDFSLSKKINRTQGYGNGTREYVNRTVIETKSKINSYFFRRFRIRSDFSLSNKINRIQGYGNGTGKIFTFTYYVNRTVPATRKKLYLNFTTRGRIRFGGYLTKNQSGSYGTVTVP